MCPQPGRQWLHSERPLFAQAHVGADSQFPSLRSPPLSSQPFSFQFLFHMKYLPKTRPTHTCASPLPSSMLPTCLCNCGVLESLLRAFCLWQLCISSPLYSLLDDLCLSCRFYDGTKTHEREGEPRMFSDWAVIQSTGQIGYRVCVGDPISSGPC